MKKLKGIYSDKKMGEWSTSGLHKRILGLIATRRGNALDIGCGSGNLARGLIKKGYSVTGVDIQKFLKDREIKFKKCDLDDGLPFKENSIDLITATEIIEHIENPRHFIREIKRVLKKGGIAIITTPNIFNWKARLYYPLKGIIWGFREEDYKISGHITSVAKYDFERICKEEGLNIKRITYNNSNRELFGDNLIVVIEK